MMTLRELQSAVSDLFLGFWIQQSTNRLAALRKPSKLRRRLERDSEPWDRVLHLMGQASQATDTAIAVELLLSSVRGMKELPGIPEKARFFVLSELVEFSSGPRIEALRRQYLLRSPEDFDLARNGIVASEYRRIGEETIAELFDADRAEYERRRESGRDELTALKS